MKQALKQIIAIALLSCLVFSFGVWADVPADANDINPIKIGESLPAITLQGTDGEDFKLNEALKKKPAILIFYRGGWCPYCNTHLGELNTIEDELVDLGYQIIAISPDQPKYLKQSIDKQKLNYRLYSDSKMHAAKALGLAFRVDDKTVKRYKDYDIDLEENSGESHQLLPVPAALIVDKKSVVRFVFVAPNYKVRIDPQLLLHAAKIYK